MLIRRRIATIAFAALGLAGCAKGQTDDPGGGGADATPDQPDAGGGGRIDAGGGEEPDAGGGGGGPVTLTQSSSNAILDDHSIACYNSTWGYTTQNSFYRVFDLPAAGVTGPLAVETVSVGIETALSGDGGSQPMRIKLHTLSGAFTLANLTQLANVLQQVGDQDLFILDVPVAATVPAGSTLVVEMFVPDGSSNFNTLFPGSNDSGQTGPTYVRATECGTNQPTDIATLSGGEDMHWVVSVSGEEQ
jgi:hypothetical protein